MINIVVPVYNCEKYFPDCLGSLESEDTSNVQFILVDDGSTDGTANICDAFCYEHANARTIHRDNAGVAAARNAGFAAIDQLKGNDWVWFVDSDDIVAPRATGVLEKLTEDTSADVIHFSYSCFDEDDYPVWKQANSEAKQVISARNYLSSTYSFRRDHYLWSFLFRKRTLDRLVKWRESYGMVGLCSENYSLLEDLVLIEELMQEACRTVLCVPDVLYGYRQSASSASHSINTEAAESALRALRYIERFDVPAPDQDPKRLMQISLLFNAYRAAGQGDNASALRGEIKIEIEKHVHKIGLSRLTNKLLTRYVALESGLGDVLLKRREAR